MCASLLHLTLLVSSLGVPDGAFNWSSILVLGFGGILSYACECKDWETSIKLPLSCSESGCEDCSETSQVSGGGTPGHSSLQVAFTGGRSLATLKVWCYKSCHLICQFCFCSSVGFAVV